MQKKISYISPLLFNFFEMSIVESSKGKDQLIPDGFRYRHANKSQTTWRCVKNNCARCATIDGYPIY